MLNRRKLRRLAIIAARFLRYAVVRFFADRCPQVAAALSFTTILAAIPLGAVGLSLVTRLPLAPALRSEVQHFVLANFVPEVGATVDRIVDNLTANAGKLTAFGLIGVVIPAFFATITVQRAFDQIWRVRAAGFVAVRALILLVVLCIGPELVGFGLLVPEYLLRLAVAGGFGPWIERFAWTLALAPPALETIGLALVFVLLPRRRVLLREALSGAVVATVLLEAAKFAFARYVAGFAQYQAIYGALSFFPALLLWIYLAWLAVLFGAVVAASLSVLRGAAVSRR